MPAWFSWHHFPPLRFKVITFLKVCKPNSCWDVFASVCLPVFRSPPSRALRNWHLNKLVNLSKSGNTYEVHQAPCDKWTCAVETDGIASLLHFQDKWIPVMNANGPVQKYFLLCLAQSSSGLVNEIWKVVSWSEPWWKEKFLMGSLMWAPTNHQHLRSGSQRGLCG